MIIDIPEGCKVINKSGIIQDIETLEIKRRYKEEGPFRGPNSEAEMALWDALHDCAADAGIDIYDYLESQPKTIIIVYLSAKLRENGFNIIQGEVK